MAKKVKKRMEEDNPYTKFQFPHFDAVGFIEHELEQSYATLLSFTTGIAAGLGAWALTRYGMSSALGVLPFSLFALVLGVVGAFGLVYLIRLFRPKWEEYRRGDWASLIMVYVFFWLGLWALFLNV